MAGKKTDFSFFDSLEQKIQEEVSQDEVENLKTLELNPNFRKGILIQLISLCINSTDATTATDEYSRVTLGRIQATARQLFYYRNLHNKTKKESGAPKLQEI